MKTFRTPFLPFLLVLFSNQIFGQTKRLQKAPNSGEMRKMDLKRGEFDTISGGASKKVAKNTKAKIEDYKIEAEAAERNADFAKVAEIRYGKIKEQEAILHVAEEKLHNLSDEKRLTDEEVDSDNIA